MDDFKALAHCIKECGCLWVPCLLSLHCCFKKSASGIKKLYIFIIYLSSNPCASGFPLVVCSFCHCQCFAKSSDVGKDI